MKVMIFALLCLMLAIITAEQCEIKCGTSNCRTSCPGSAICECIGANVAKCKCAAVMVNHQIWQL